MVLKIQLPHPPSINHYWRHTRSGKHYISKEGRDFRAVVCGTLRAAKVNPYPMPTRLAITIHWHPPDRRRRDADNIFKPLFDALEHGGAFEDDWQIRHIFMSERGVKKPGSVILKIETEDELECTRNK